MEGYDPSGMPYLQDPNSYSNVNTAKNSCHAPSYTQQQHQLNGYTSSENVGSNVLSFIPQTMLPVGRQSLSTGYEEGFFEINGPQGDVAARVLQQGEGPTIDRDNKLLSFHPSVVNQNIFDRDFGTRSVSISAQLHGMFFLAETARAHLNMHEVGGPQPELTCYRRNLFQISGSVTLPRKLGFLFDGGGRPPIVTQELCISATESVEGNPVKIISVPWKSTSTGGPAVAEDKTEKEPEPIPLSSPTPQDLDGDYVVHPIAWKRLQFRTATANNGRRKELQQHFVITLSVMATLPNGKQVSVCEATSGPIVVRGRSPRNFQARKDLPLSGSGGSIRRSMATAVSPTAIKRASTVDGGQHWSSKSDSGSETNLSRSVSDAMTLSEAGFQASDWQSYPQSSSTTSGFHYTSGQPTNSIYSRSPTGMHPETPRTDLKRKSSSPMMQKHASMTGTSSVSQLPYRQTAPLERPYKMSRSHHSNPEIFDKSLQSQQYHPQLGSSSHHSIPPPFVSATSAPSLSSASLLTPQQDYQKVVNNNDTSDLMLNYLYRQVLWYIFASCNTSFSLLVSQPTHTLDGAIISLLSLMFLYVV